MEIVIIFFASIITTINFTLYVIAKFLSSLLEGSKEAITFLIAFAFLLGVTFFGLTLFYEFLSHLVHGDLMQYISDYLILYIILGFVLLCIFGIIAFGIQFVTMIIGFVIKFFVFVLSGIIFICGTIYQYFLNVMINQLENKLL